MRNFLGLFLCSIFLWANIATAATTPVVNIQQWETANGTKVMYVYLPEIPMVDISIVFAAGSARDSEKYGLANITSSMLSEGTIKRTASEIAESFESVGAQFGATTSLDTTIVSLRSLTDSQYLQPALSALSEVLAQPAFPEKNFKRVKNEILTAIQETKQNPSQVANNTYYHLVYGDYPYGHPTLGVENIVQELKLEDVKQFYENFYTGANALIAIVGDVKRDQAENIANQVMAELPKGKKAKPLPPPAFNAGPLHKQIRFPSSQTYIRIGNLGTKYDDPLNYALHIGNYILGGKPLISRLFNEVREKRGLTYNITSAFTPYQETGTFTIGLQTRNDTAKKAIELSTDILNKFWEKGPTIQEVAKAKQGIIDSFPTIISSNSNLLNIITTIGFYDLPLDYLDTYRDKISAITVNDINIAFKKIVKPKQLITVTVGASDKTESKKIVQISDVGMIPITW